MKVFRVGDKVIALTAPQSERSQHREIGKTYTVQNVTFCYCCGVQSINIGEKTNSEKTKCSCGCVASSRGNFWTKSKHFASVDKAEDEMREAVASENYELAATLRDFLKNFKLK